MINWIELSSIENFEEAVSASFADPVLIYKHSTRCPVSSMALDRLERTLPEDIKVMTFYLDLIRYRETSDAIERTLRVEHQSPQVILIHEGKAIYDTSHMAIDGRQIASELSNYTDS